MSWKLKPRIFAENSWLLKRSADCSQMAVVADDDELATAFKEVESPLAHLFLQHLATDLTLDIADRTAHDAARAGRFAGENLCTPRRRDRAALRDEGMNHVHSVMVARNGKPMVKADRF
ncbi:MAG: hypothetical protein ACRC14_01520 [Paracoccaceae bacterium]